MADFFAANDGNPWGGMAEEVLPGHRQLAGHHRDPEQLSRQRELGRRTHRRGRSTRSGGRGSSRRHSGRSIRHIGRRRPRSTSRRSSGSSSRSVSASTSGTSIPDVPGPLNTYVTIGYAIGLSFAGDVHGGEPRDHRLLLARAARRVQLVQAPDRAGHRVHRDDPGLLRRPRRGHPADPRSRRWRRWASRTRSCLRSSASGCSSASSSGSTSGSRERDKLRSVREAMGETDERRRRRSPATPA